MVPKHYLEPKITKHLLIFRWWITQSLNIKPKHLTYGLQAININIFSYWAVLGLWLDFMISKVFPYLNDSMVLYIPIHGSDKFFFYS